ncbi:MAG: phycobilisome linker polypeptide, partial [Cyanobacteria bacterium P01_F01_bin.3]
EYIDNFGEATVPYARSIRTQVGNTTEGFNRMFALLRGSATSDLGKQGAKLISSLAANTATPIKPLAKGNAAYGNLSKRFRISFASSQSAARLKRFSQQTIVVNYEQMAQAVRNIHSSGGKISGISELA